ncbi:MAG: hypothetical protein B6I20_03595 [Bacteroidetes bacterium 4572_117]|nr:MAG: hypothetical protein B6I20_03595 [Bacteroidetes bacterium 4572_117]
MIIIADTSALIALSTCNALHLLEALFEKIAVPKLVYDECVIVNKSQSEKLLNFLCNRIELVENTKILDLPSNLGQGEISAMLLYKKVNANYLLIDDNRARKIAKYNDINIVGSLGILLIAKHKKLIKKITPFINMLEESEIYISKQLVHKIKKLAKE